MKNKYLTNLYLPKKPNFVTLDASSMCQLECPGCQTGRRENKHGVVGWGYLRFSDFKRFVDENPFVERIELSNWGEIFLNPELKKILLYAHIKGVILYVGNGTNLNTVSDDLLESVVKYQVRVLRVSIDGATNESYRIYRVNGDLNKVIRNIRKINNYKKKHNTIFPQLIWQFLIFGHNEHELELARKTATELDMEFLPKLNLDRGYSPVRNAEKVENIVGFDVNPTNIPADKIRSNIFLCRDLWKRPHINWDGKLLGCCTNTKQAFGNVFVEGLETCLQSKDYVYAKEMLMGNKPPRKDIVCSSCRYYKAFSELLKWNS